MNFSIEFVSTIISPIISALGFFVTLRSIRVNFNYTLKQKVTDEQRKVYLDTYMDVEKIITANEVIFDPDYYKQLDSHRAQIKLAASNAVINAYHDYMKFVYDVQCMISDWVYKNNPNNNPDNFKYDSDEYGEEIEISHVTQEMMDIFELQYEEYKREHTPSSKEITNNVDRLLNAMRADLGNSAYIRD